uniref:Uncharacterized protein n=1 Tax=Rhizophora mucronata TaxID=61149 RepID=A0A2P2QIN7_RHIMU
MHKTKIEL